MSIEVFKEKINELSKHIYQLNVDAGWWDDMDRPIKQLLMLCITEVSEATEGFRKDMMDDHLPQYKMEAVEMADTLIRLFDIAGRFDWQYILKAEPVYGAAYSSLCLSERHFCLVLSIVNIGEKIDRRLGAISILEAYSISINTALAICENEGYPIEEIIQAKLEYNKNREDHKRENRAKQNGKKI